MPQLIALLARAGLLTQGACTAVVGFAGILKLVDIHSFAASLRSWALLPDWSLGMIVIVVPTLEIGLCIAWMLNLRRRSVANAVTGLLALFLVVYVLHWALAKPPKCACLGEWLAFGEGRRDAVFIVIRNSVLITAMIVGSQLVGASTRQSVHRRRPLDPHSTVRAHGFTLVETILVIVLIGLLVVVLLPALTSTNIAMKRAADLSNLRTHMQAIAMYADANKEHFPAISDPKATLSVIRNDNGVIAYPYFASVTTWAFALSFEMYDMPFTSRVFRSPFEPKQSKSFTSYGLSATTMADPRFFDATTRTGPNQWRATYVHEVAHPQDKGIFISLAPWPFVQSRSPASLACADGHALTIRSDMLAKPYPFGEGHWPGALLGVGVPVLHTPMGLHGVDTR